MIRKKPNLIIIAFSLLLLNSAALAQTLGTTNLLESCTSGSDSVMLAANGTWTATTNASWLHLSASDQSGMGSTNVIFTFDANPGATRTGTLTIAGQTLTVTQAGSTYVAANPVTTLVSLGFNFPNSVVLDGAGNVYVPSSYYNTIYEWMAASNTVTTLVSSDLSDPIGLAMDGAGNLYIGDYGDNAIKKWSATNGAITTLVSSGLSFPEGVAAGSVPPTGRERSAGGHRARADQKDALDRAALPAALCASGRRLATTPSLGFCRCPAFLALTNLKICVLWRCFDLAMLTLAPPSQVGEALAGSSAISTSG